MIDDLLDAIEAADLPAPMYRTAVRLARLCAGGRAAILSYAEIAAICGTEADNTVRGHLAKLHQVGLFSYKRNAVVTVWLAGPTGNQRALGDQSDRPARDLIAQRSSSPSPLEARDRPARDLIAERANRALDDHGENGSDNQRALGDQIDRPARDLIAERANRALDDQPITTTTTTGRQEGYPACLPALEGGAGEGTPPAAPELPTTHEPSGAEQSAPDAASRQRAVDLLTDEEVGLDRALAQRLAAEFPFEEIRRQVFRLRRDIQAGSARSPGALASRLRNRFGATVTDADRRSALWQRHETPEDRESEYSRHYPADLANALDDSPMAEAEPGPEPGTPAALWQQLRIDLSHHRSAGTPESDLIRGVLVHPDSAPGRLVLTVPHTYLDWVRAKMANQIKRRLAIIAGQAVDVEFRTDQEESCLS
jgi:hypothetical protein